MRRGKPSGARWLASVLAGATVLGCWLTSATAQRSAAAPGPAAPRVVARAACPAAPLPEARAAVRYVCDCGAGAEPGCVPGDDAADGRSPATAFRSYARARKSFEHGKAGSMTAFCRGGSFTAGKETRWVDGDCRAERPCVIRDYTAAWGGSAKPLVRVTEANSRAFSLENGGPAEHDEGYVIMGLALRGPGSGVGVFLYNDVDDVMLCDLAIEGFGIGVHAGGANPAPPKRGSDGKNARIVLRNSRIANNANQGWLGACDDCSIEYNRFEKNGFAREILDHNIYIAGDNHGQRVVGNELLSAAPIDGKCSGASLVVHGNMRGLRIEDNLIREEVGAARPQCWGIAVDTGYDDTPEAFSDVVIRGNTVINVGSVGIGLNACDRCVVENNVIVHEQPFASTAIAVPDRDRKPNDGALARAIVRNNAIYVGPGGGTGIKLGGEGKGHIAVSNSIHYAGSAADWSCFDFDLDPAGYAGIDHNVCHAAKGATQWVRGRGDLDPESSSPTTRDGVRRVGKPDIGAYESGP